MRNDKVVFIWELYQTGNAYAVPIIKAATNDQDWQVREVACQALGHIAHPGALPVLIRALGDEEWEVRHMAAWAIGETLKKVVTCLKNATNDDVHWVKQEALNALKEIEELSKTADECENRD